MRAALAVALMVGASTAATGQGQEAALLAAAKELGRLTPGGTFKTKENVRLVGCKDKGTLMFVERMAGGDKTDQETANQLAARDCDAPNENGRYTRCAPAGFAWPMQGGRLTFSGYCRVGRNEQPLFIRDDFMVAVPAVTSPQDCKAFVRLVAQAVNGKLEREDDNEFNLELLPPLSGKGQFLNNYASVTCEPWAEAKWNVVGLHWTANDSPPAKFFSVVSDLAKLILNDSISKPVDECVRKARRGGRDIEVRTSKTLITCNAETGRDGSASVHIELLK